ncbi:MAG: hypothetical protein WDM81_11380 [Rhizomicrobium sp.]
MSGAEAGRVADCGLYEGVRAPDRVDKRQALPQPARDGGRERAAGAVDVPVSMRAAAKARGGSSGVNSMSVSISPSP